MKFSTKILLLFLLMVVLFLTAEGVFVYTDLRSTLDNEIGKQQAQFARQIMEEIDIFLYERLQDIKTVGQSPAVIQALIKRDKNSVAAGAKKLREFFSTTGPWNNLVVIGTDGKILISSYEIPDLGKRPGILIAYQEALKDRVYYSDAVLSLVTDKPTIFYSYPMKDSDTAGSPIVGVVVGELSWPALTEYLNKVQTGAVVHLINKQGIEVGTNIEEDQDEVLSADYSQNGVVKRALAGESVAEEATSLHGDFSSLTTSATETEHHDYLGNGWVLLLETPASVALASAGRAAGEISLLVGFLAVVCSLLMYFLIDKFVTKPISSLAELIKQIGVGNFSGRVPVVSGDEIGQLGKTFNEMSSRLEDLYSNLEAKVRSRTEELSQKNRSLEETQRAVVNLLEDLSREKEALAVGKARSDAILSGIGDGVFVLDAERKIILFNAIAEKISGFSSGEVAGRKYTDVLKFLFEENDQVNDRFVETALNEGKIAQMANHTVLVRKDGERVQVADSAAPVRNSEGKIFGCVVVFRDVTQEREVEKMKTEFVSVASHQLRTPLTGVKWFTEFLLKHNLDDKAREYAENIKLSNERMIRLVDSLLNVSRIETGRKFDIVLKDADIVPVMHSVIEEQAPVAHGKNISLVCSADAPKELVLPIDELKIRQVFQNLISNSIKYSRGETVITIGCQHKDDEVIFFVKDSGVGIPAAQHNRVFSKFFRADNAISMHADGTGLGLYIVKAIVEAHGGRIWFDSVENQGTTFYVALPRARKV